eukprot:CAMPEP_0169423772 /NCGR_PEP_ID=MMETSP1017-20121227/67679_1 /TAXON_ID=342587 /ORGANISM="Karlodinium micrum, Strain CCMP2283" /LENGTH=472 /DNA_ID=CAMNT_0009533499 /DNA_START=381 /DNA_END=1796 /DNA_ORIENTATION=-
MSSRRRNYHAESVRPPSPRIPKKTIQELRAVLDASYSPAMLSLRQNCHNLRKSLDTKTSVWCPRIGVANMPKVEQLRELLSRNNVRTHSPREHALHSGAIWRLTAEPHDDARWKKQKICLYVNGDLCFQNPSLGNRFEVLLDREQLMGSEVVRFQGTEHEYGFEIVIKESSVTEKFQFACESAESCREWVQALIDAKTCDRNAPTAITISSSAQREAESSESSPPGGRRPSLPGGEPPSRPSGHGFLRVQQVPELPSAASSRSPSKASARGGALTEMKSLADSPRPGRSPRSPRSPRRTPVASPRAKSREPSPAPNPMTGKMTDEDKVKNLEKELSGSARVAAAFSRLKDEGEIHRDYLPIALDLVGFQHQVIEHIVELFSSVTSYASLDYGEFIKFVKLYDEKMFEEYIPIFNRFDEAHNGVVDVSCVDEILRNCHLSYASTALKDMLTDAADSFRQILYDFRLEGISEGV